MYDNHPNASTQPEHIKFAISIADDVTGRFSLEQRGEFLLFLKKTIIGQIHLTIEKEQEHLLHLKKVVEQLEKI